MSGNFLTSLVAVIGTLTLFCLSDHVKEATITLPPLPVNTSANREVVFSCAADNANTFIWYLNDTYVKSFTDLLSDVETNLTRSPPHSFVRIWIPQDYSHLNESWIKCNAVHDSSESGSVVPDSAEALLLIQGPLKPIDNIEVQPHCETTKINVSWSRPYTLKGIEISSYNTCMDDDCHHIEADVQSTTVSFPVIDLPFADKYHLCVQAHDCSSDNFTKLSCVNFTLNEVPYWIHHRDVQTTLTFVSNAYKVEFDISLEENICRVPQNYSINIIYSNGTNIALRPSLTDQTISSTSFVVHLDEHLKEMSIDIKIVSTNSAGSNSSDPIHFALFHVQDAFANGNNITCKFVEGSNAQGCSTTLICVNATTTAPVATCKIFRASQADKEAYGSFVCQETLPNCTSYNVNVYDLYSDGTVSNQEALVLTNVAVSPQPSPTSGFKDWWPAIPSGLVILVLLVCLIAAVVYLVNRQRKKGSETFTELNDKKDSQEQVAY